MMRRLIALLATILLAAVTLPAAADGLLYQLPQDGSWVLFDNQLKMTQGDVNRDAAGTLRMSSVGGAIEDGAKCRWIEFNMTMNVNDLERVIIAKLLVPEDQLKEGHKPFEHRVRGWIRMSADGEVQELTENNFGPIPAFLANPLTDVRQLEAKTVTSKLGELSCPGVTGKTQFAERSTNNKVTYETRRHDNAPFGVVTSKVEIDVERDGQGVASLEMTLTIQDFGETAKSELPDHN